jgi:hypothetical protein
LGGKSVVYRFEIKDDMLSTTEGRDLAGYRPTHEKVEIKIKRKF